MSEQQEYFGIPPKEKIDVEARPEFVSVAGQVEFPVIYRPGYVDVFRNGILLPTNAFTAANGTSVTLLTPCEANETIRFTARRQVAVSNVYPREEAAALISPAFQGTPTAPTPSQFDNDTSLATTEFVQRALGNFKTVLAFNTNQTFTSGHAGSLIYSYGPAVAFTLPSVSTMVAGSSLTIVNYGTGLTVSRAGTDALTVNGSTTPTSITVSPGDSLVFTAMPSVGGWVVQGTGNLKYSGAFSLSTAGNGYQKLPSGLIIQWGTYNLAGENISGTFPIAFPTWCMSAVINMQGDNGSVVLSSWNATSWSGSSMVSNVNTTGTYNYNIIAIGS